MRRYNSGQLAILVTALGIGASAWVRAQEEGFKSLFNGKDLSGWAGRPNHWSVEDGSITGTTTKENPAAGNNFLIAKVGQENLIVRDFELRFSYRFTGPWGNSGLQYRSKEVGNFVVHGYQADFEVGPTYSGILYEEGGRGILAQRGQKTIVRDDPAKAGSPKIEVVGSVGDSNEIQAAIRTNGWNDYVVIAQGNHLRHFINGKATADVIDEQTSKAAAEGILALQLHAGPPMKIQFKNIRIKTLSAATAAGSDLDRAQGEWTATEFIADGQSASADRVAALRLKISGKEFVVDSGEGQERGTLQFNEAKSPKWMDVTTQSGDEAPGIYQLTADTFKVCYANNGASRPTEFKSGEGSNHVLITFKRKPQ